MARLYHFLCPGVGLSYGGRMSDELAFLDATAQAELVRRGELSPSALVDAAIARIEAVNPKLNAVIIPLFEKARAQAASADLPRGPFRGVPFLLKDLLAYSAGDPHHMGTRLLKRLGFVAPHDSNTAARLRAAGFVFLGKTNAPEIGTLPTTEPEAYGPTRNPWDPGRSTGGSSGGSAAAVAAGMVPAAHANDGGGSIRIPASECGLVGLKPSRARISFGPDLGEPLAGLAHEGVVTRSVRDTARLLDVLTGASFGPDDLDPLNRALSELGRACTAPQYLATVDWLHAYSRRMAGWWASGFDLLLTPTLPQPPPPLGTFTPTREDPVAAGIRAAQFAGFTSPFNMTGQPAISLPLEWNDEGLPIGIQPAAAYGREDLLIRVAAQLEQARPWAGRRPPIHA